MKRNALLIGIDVVIAGFALLGAYLLRYNLELPPNVEGVLFYTAGFCAISAVVFFLFGVHRGVWRFASVNDLRNIVLASTTSMLVFLLAMFLVDRLTVIPRSVPLIAWFVMIVLLSAPRVIYRVWMARRQPGSARSKLLIFGSASEAERVIRRFGLETSAEYEVVGIVAFSSGFTGRKVRGIGILGDVASLDDIVAHLSREGRRPNSFVVAEPREHRAALTTITETGVANKIPVRRVVEPPSLLKGESGAKLDALTLEDLLGRKPAHLELERISQLIEGSTVMVTGAGGSIGSEIARQVAGFRPGRLLLLDNSEFALYSIDHEMQENHAALERMSVIASVRDRQTIFRLMAEVKPDIVFHAAALKHVPLIESNICEGVLTNVIGTKNIADAATANGVKAMVMISTDKAIRPTSVMGASKRAAESYCQALDISGAPTRFITVRFGNVLGSNGSVIPLFESQIRVGGPVTVTHPGNEALFHEHPRGDRARPAGGHLWPHGAGATRRHSRSRHGRTRQDRRSGTHVDRHFRQTAGYRRSHRFHRDQAGRKALRGIVRSQRGERAGPAGRPDHGEAPADRPRRVDAAHRRTRGRGRGARRRAGARPHAPHCSGVPASKR